ncbi:MAG: hypothetical protein FRX49_00256 [Trebouxia sp. A1-2]|nr:MAG: hypothetical protein FRX49_00256 [Trebouxia sp. A1-2]
MTSAYLIELRQRLGVARDRLHEELAKVPVDYTKAAFYQQEVKDLREDIRLCSTTGDLGKVVFGVTAEHSEFPNFEFELSTINNEVLLEDIEKRLSWHDPPLRLKTVNNVPASARPSNKALVANFKDGDRLELVADIAPGIVLTALYNVSSWIVKLTTGKGK